MKNIYLYAHGGSGNHGCEAIVRSTVKLLDNVPHDKIILVSSNPDEDTKYGLDEICEIISEKNPLNKKTWKFIKAYIKLKLKKNYLEMDKLEYSDSIDKVNPEDIAISIGGDNYCYADVERYIMLHDMYLARGAKTVLWGCSVEPKLLENPRIAADLARYSLITARETISYEALKKVNENTVLIADPAFTLEKKDTKLAESITSKNIVGINLSPMVVDNEHIEGIAYECYQELMDMILNETDMSIVLIPHVVWNHGDDRKALKQLMSKYENDERVAIVDDMNCMELKHIISKCRFFVGARTHSTIAAYSTGVPTLVVGYSVKARGIACDLFGTYEGYVLPVQEIENSCKIKKVFQELMQNEMQVKEILDKNTKIKLEYIQEQIDQNWMQIMRR